MTEQQRKLVRALGYDPASVDVEVRKRPFRGMLVMDHARKPLRFFTVKQLQRLADSREFLERWDAG